MLKIKRNRFFELLAKYHKDPDSFSIQYERKTINRKIDPDIEKNIIKELKIEKDLIKNKDVPIKYYNYSFIKDILEQKYNQKISLPTIIDRAKRNNFYFLRPKRKAHDREVLTNYPGELIQHDSSHHLFAPYAARKWYLITSIDETTAGYSPVCCPGRKRDYLETYPSLRRYSIKIWIPLGLLCR